jgi:DNA-binding NarL/FixJ family response regulator
VNDRDLANPPGSHGARRARPRRARAARTPATEAAAPRDGAAPARIFIVDDEPIVRRGLRLLISLQSALTVCGEAAGVRDTVEQVAALRPDLAVVDLSLKDGDGVELVRRLHDEFRGLRILVFSMHEEARFVERALRAGAHGYVVKEEGADTAVRAIRLLLEGGRYLSGRLAGKLADADFSAGDEKVS